MELAFNVRFRLGHALDTDEAIAFMNRLQAEVLTPNELMLNGAGDEVWQVVIASLQPHSAPTEKHRTIFREWLQQHPLVRMAHVADLRECSNAEVAFHEEARRGLLGLEDDEATDA